MMKLATGKDDPELPLLQRISSLELPALEIADEINATTAFCIDTPSRLVWAIIYFSTGQ